MRVVWITPEDVEMRQIEEACCGGIDTIQLRCKRRSMSELSYLAERARDVTWKHGLELWINTHAPLARDVEADQLHLPERAALPSEWTRRFSRSVHSLSSAQQAEQEGCHAVLFGPIFHTPSKAKIGAPQGLGALQVVAKSVQIPVYAVGGVTFESAYNCMQHGAAGIAFIRGLGRNCGAKVRG